MRIDFYLIDAMEIENYAPIWAALRKRGVEAELVAVPGSRNSVSNGWFDYENAVKILTARELPFTDKPYHGCAAAITTQYPPVLAAYRGAKLRLMYGVHLSDTFFTHARNACEGFDGVLAHGAYSQSKVMRWLPEERVPIIGYPKYDNYFQPGLDGAKVKEQLELTGRPVIVYLPTWESRCSIDQFFPLLAPFAESCDLIVKPHHCTTRMEPERMKLLSDSDARIVPGNFPIAELYAVADLVVADISSGAFSEAILTDRRLIGILPNQQDGEAHVDERVFQAAPICTDPAELPNLVRDVLASDGYKEIRENLREELFSHCDGHAADRAAEAILQVVDNFQRQRFRALGRSLRVRKEHTLNAVGSNVMVQRIRHPARTIRSVARRLDRVSPKIGGLLKRIGNSSRSNGHLNLTTHHRKAMQWVEANSVPGAGIRVFHGSPNTYPEVSGYFIPSLRNWGKREKAIQYAKWLISIQNPDGSWSDSMGKNPYTFDTGQILKGLLAVADWLPEVESPIRRGCDWMLKQIDNSGRITTPDKSEWKLSGGQMISENIHLYALEPLRVAGERFNEPRYGAAVELALKFYVAKPDLVDFNTLSHFHAYVIEALVDLGETDAAARGMVEIGLLQRPDGSVPGLRDENWVCSTGLAQYAVIWYKLGMREQAAKAFNYLCRIQNSSGGFYGSYGRGADYLPNKEISWAVKYFLDAYYWHVRTTFDGQASGFPDTIEENDGRLRAVLGGLGDVSEKRILDAGCGRGRFARAILGKFPSVDLWGVDLSAQMLRCVPAGVKTKQGSLLDLPFEDNFFDCMFSVEALEHCVDPEAAIRELCRVVKPGGRIVIIDKNIQRQGTLKIEDWERWFDSNEVEAWLSRYCSSVGAELITYGKLSEPDGLFIAWSATRR